MSFVVRDCYRCGANSIQMMTVGTSYIGAQKWEIACACQRCLQISVYTYNSHTQPDNVGGDLEAADRKVGSGPIRVDVVVPTLPEAIPERVRTLFVEATASRRAGRFEAAGAIFRKTIDVGTKLMFQTDERLKQRTPADALRSRIKALGEMKILDEDIVELADVAALDGNDAVHDLDPYTAGEAEALEDLTTDLLDRLYVRPAKLRAVRDKQIAAGQRKA